jgi:hypothetical protein
MSSITKEEVNVYLDSVSYTELVQLRNVIDKRIYILEKQAKNDEIAKLGKANIQIKDTSKCTTYGIGIVLVIDLISPGIIRQGFTYTLPHNTNHNTNHNGKERQIIIKCFDNIFASSQYEYPNCGVAVSVRLINCKFEDLYIDMILEHSN